MMSEHLDLPNVEQDKDLTVKITEVGSLTETDGTSQLLNSEPAEKRQKTVYKCAVGFDQHSWKKFIVKKHDLCTALKPGLMLHIEHHEIENDVVIISENSKIAFKKIDIQKPTGPEPDLQDFTLLLKHPDSETAAPLAVTIADCKKLTNSGNHDNILTARVTEVMEKRNVKLQRGGRAIVKNVVLWDGIESVTYGLWRNHADLPVQTGQYAVVRKAYPTPPINGQVYLQSLGNSITFIDAKNHNGPPIQLPEPSPDVQEKTTYIKIEEIDRASFYPGCTVEKCRFKSLNETACCKKCGKHYALSSDAAQAARVEIQGKDPATGKTIQGVAFRPTLDEVFTFPTAFDADFGLSQVVDQFMAMDSAPVPFTFGGNGDVINFGKK